MKETIKNYNIIGFIKTKAEQNWTPIPEGTMVSIPSNNTINNIEFTELILKEKFPYYMFYLEEME